MVVVQLIQLINSVVFFSATSQVARSRKREKHMEPTLPLSSSLVAARTHQTITRKISFTVSSLKQGLIRYQTVIVLSIWPLLPFYLCGGRADFGHIVAVFFSMPALLFCFIFCNFFITLSAGDLFKISAATASAAASAAAVALIQLFRP